jgi:hypothetical protein
MRTALTAGGLLLALLFSAWAGGQALAPAQTAAVTDAQPQVMASPVAGVECTAVAGSACGTRLAQLGPPPLEWR